MVWPGFVFGSRRFCPILSDGVLTAGPGVVFLPPPGVSFKNQSPPSATPSETPPNLVNTSFLFNEGHATPPPVGVLKSKPIAFRLLLKYAAFSKDSPLAWLLANVSKATPAPLFQPAGLAYYV